MLQSDALRVHVCVFVPPIVDVDGWGRRYRQIYCAVRASCRQLFAPLPLSKVPGFLRLLRLQNEVWPTTSGDDRRWNWACTQLLKSPTELNDFRLFLELSPAEIQFTVAQHRLLKAKVPAELVVAQHRLLLEAKQNKKQK